MASNETPAPSPDPAKPPLFVPEHELIRVIGRGSYGEVWLARSVLGRLRAVKFVFKSRFDEEKPFEREYAGIAKFEPISRLHNGFVVILQIGLNEQDGYFYYIMEAADDLAGQTDPKEYAPRTLSADLRKNGRRSVRQTIELGLEVANALAFLHDHRLVHRDIKPSNIVFINSRPRLADIGLVADLDSTLTFVGTPGFMPREGPGTVSADIFSLGKVLYEATTGKDRHHFPEYPDPAGFPDYNEYFELNEILVKACHPDPAQRYSDARELAHDLQLLLNGQSVLRLRNLERRMHLFKRAAIIFVLAAAGLSAVGVPWFQARQMSVRMEQQEYGRKRIQAAEALAAGDYTAALRLYANTPPASGASPETVATEHLRLNLLQQNCPSFAQIFRLGSEIDDVAFTPDGNMAVAAAEDGKLHWLDLSTGDSSLFAHTANANSVQFSKDGAWLLTGHTPAGAVLWSVPDRKPVRHFDPTNTIYSARFSPDERQVLLGGIPNEVNLMDLASGKLVRSFPHGSTVDSVSFSPDGKLVATAGRNARVKVWSLGPENSDTPLHDLPHESWVYYTEFMPDSKRLITSEHENLGRVWDLDSGREKIDTMRHKDGVRSAVFGPRENRIVTASYDHVVQLWSGSRGEMLSPVLHQAARAMRARFSPDETRLITACSDGTVRLYDLQKPLFKKVEGSLFSHDFQQSMRFSEIEPPKLQNRSMLGSIRMAEGWVVLWEDKKTGLSCVSFHEPRGALRWEAMGASTSERAGLAEAGPGKVLVADRDSVRLIDASSGRELWRKDAPSSHSGVAAAQDGSRFALVSGKSVEMFEIQPVVRHLWTAEHANRLEAGSFSPDGLALAVYERDSTFTQGRAYPRDAATGELIAPELRHRDGVLHAVFSADRQFLATGDEDARAHVWNLKDGSRVGPLAHEENVHFVALSRTGRWLATLSGDKKARLWDARTGEPISPPLWHEAEPTRCAFSPNDESLFVEDEDRNVFEWKLDASPPNWSELRPFVELTTPEDNERALEHWAELQKARKPRQEKGKKSHQDG